MTASISPGTYRKAVFEWARETGLDQVRLVIFQPKVDGASEHVMSIDELEDFAVQLHDKAQFVRDADADHKSMAFESWWPIYLNPEPNDADCAWCRAMPVCPSVQAKLQRDTGLDFTAMPEESALPDTVAAYTPIQLSTFMKAVPLLEMASKAVRAETERRLMAGQQVADFGLELGRQGNREFSDVEEAERLLRKQFRIKIEDAYNMKLKSAPQVEKLTKPTKGEDGAEVPPLLGPKQWKQLEKLIVRADAKPSVKPLSAIKNPWTPPQISVDGFGAVDEGCDLA
jgi:hypothetical protein